MIELRKVDADCIDDLLALYRLLGERTPEESISHRHMPSLTEHIEFVRSQPYEAWYLIMVGIGAVGSIYLSKQREIGVFIFRVHQRKGYGRAAVLELMRLHPGRFLANVNPANDASHGLWQGLGGRLIQVTYQL